MNESIQSTIRIFENELEETFIRSSGAGGQNVNKVSSAVQLRFNLLGSKSFSESIKLRLINKLKNRLTQTGDIVIVARESRSQEINRKTARDKLIQIISKALVVQKPRKKTAPTNASKERRLVSKQKRGDNKKLRSKKVDF